MPLHFKGLMSHLTHSRLGDFGLLETALYSKLEAVLLWRFSVVNNEFVNGGIIRNSETESQSQVWRYTVHMQLHVLP